MNSGSELVMGERKRVQVPQSIKNKTFNFILVTDQLNYIHKNKNAKMFLIKKIYIYNTSRPAELMGREGERQ